MGAPYGPIASSTRDTVTSVHAGVPPEDDDDAAVLAATVPMKRSIDLQSGQTGARPALTNRADDGVRSPCRNRTWTCSSDRSGGYISAVDVDVVVVIGVVVVGVGVIVNAV